MPAVEINPRVKSILAELRRGYEQIYGDRMVKLVLFGSQARGEAREDSDIDVLVVLKGPVEPAKERDRIGEFRAALCLEHERLWPVSTCRRNSTVRSEARCW